MTPAMAAGVTDRLWEVADIVALMDAAQDTPKKRGPYQKRQVGNDLYLDNKTQPSSIL